jgi:hypothetical protein
MIIVDRPGPVGTNHPQHQEKQNHPHAEKITKAIVAIECTDILAQLQNSYYKSPKHDITH